MAFNGYVAALEANDARGAMAFWQDASLYIPLGAPTLRSRADIEAYVSAVYKTSKVEYQVSVDEIDAGTDMASIVGTYSATVRASGKPAATRGGRYLFVPKRQGDGSWKVSRAITSDPEPKK